MFCLLCVHSASKNVTNNLFWFWLYKFCFVTLFYLFLLRYFCCDRLCSRRILLLLNPLMVCTCFVSVLLFHKIFIFCQILFPISQIPYYNFNRSQRVIIPLQIQEFWVENLPNLLYSVLFYSFFCHTGLLILFFFFFVRVLIFLISLFNIKLMINGDLIVKPAIACQSS